MVKSTSFRKLSLNSKKNFSCKIPDFFYLKEKHLIVSLIIVFVLNKRFDENFYKIFNLYKKFQELYPEKKENFSIKLGNFKENIYKRIILFIFGKPKKIII